MPKTIQILSTLLFHKKHKTWNKQTCSVSYHAGYRKIIILYNVVCIRLLKFLLHWTCISPALLKLAVLISPSTLCLGMFLHSPRLRILACNLLLQVETLTTFSHLTKVERMKICNFTIITSSNSMLLREKFSASCKLTKHWQPAVTNASVKPNKQTHVSTRDEWHSWVFIQVLI